MIGSGCVENAKRGVTLLGTIDKTRKRGNNNSRSLEKRSIPWVNEVPAAKFESLTSESAPVFPEYI